MEKFEKKIVEEIIHDLVIIQSRIDNINSDNNISLEDAVSCIDDVIIDLKDYML
jgi:hypothetical protein